MICGPFCNIPLHQLVHNSPHRAPNGVDLYTTASPSNPSPTCATSVEIVAEECHWMKHLKWICVCGNGHCCFVSVKSFITHRHCVRVMDRERKHIINELWRLEMEYLVWSCWRSRDRGHTMDIVKTQCIATDHSNHNTMNRLDINTKGKRAKLHFHRYQQSCDGEIGGVSYEWCRDSSDSLGFFEWNVGHPEWYAITSADPQALLMLSVWYEVGLASAVDCWVWNTDGAQDNDVDCDSLMTRDLSLK